MTENVLPPAAGWHPTESELLNGLAEPSPVSPVPAHLRSCLRCRVFAARLATVERQSASGAALTALTEASPPLPDGLLATLRRHDSEGAAAPSVGQLWRATDRTRGVEGGVAVLVWIRRVFDATVAVLPVVLDTGMADEYSLLLTPDSTPLGVELAVLTGVDAEIGVANLVGSIGTLDIADAVREVRRSADTGQPPATAGVRTGTPIVRDDDQRIEYRQVVGELLNSLGLTRDEPDDDSADAQRFSLLSLMDTLRDLAYLEPGLRIEQTGAPDGIHVDPAHLLHPVAAVHHLSTCVLVVVLTGPDPLSALLSSRVPSLCQSLQQQYVEADSLAVCAAAQDWPALMLSPADTGRAMSVPSGTFSEPRAPQPPLELVTALRKLFDGSRGTWQDATPVRFDDLEASLRNVRSLSGEAARAAVADIRRQGTRAVIPSKQHGYAAVDDAAVRLVESLIAAVLDGADPDEAVRDLLGDSP